MPKCRDAGNAETGRYFSMIREPRTRVVLSVFKNDGSTASICSKKDDRAGTFCWLG